MRAVEVVKLRPLFEGIDGTKFEVALLNQPVVLVFKRDPARREVGQSVIKLVQGGISFELEMIIRELV